MKKHEMLDHLLEWIEPEALLNEIVQGLDVGEMEGVYRHILRMWDIPALDEDEEGDYDIDEDDAAWREEIAMEAGMAHGIDAYNDVLGCSVGDLDEDYGYGE